MIQFPKVGMHVKVHYRKSLQSEMPLQNKLGTILVLAKGRGPRNVLVLIQGKKYIIPRGNLNNC